MQNLAYISQNFSPYKTSSYNLSIQIALNGLSFCIIDTPNDDCLVIKNLALNKELSREAWEDQLIGVLNGESLLNGPWKQVRVIWSSRKSLMIPSHLFRTEDLRSYMVLHQLLEEYDEIQHIRLQSPDAWVVFPIPSSITQLIINRFPGALFYHQSVPMIESILHRKGSPVPDGIHVNLQEDFFNYAIIQGGELQSFNSFSWKDVNDILYLVVYLYRQFEFSTKAQELVLYGMGEDHAEVIKLLKKYILYVRKSEPDERFHIQNIGSLGNPYAYTILLNLYFCVS
jgi:hypothetical protein